MARTSTNVVCPSTFNVDILVDAPYKVETDVQIKLLLTAKYENLVVDNKSEFADKLFKFVFVVAIELKIVVVEAFIFDIFKAE